MIESSPRLPRKSYAEPYINVRPGDQPMRGDRMKFAKAAQEIMNAPRPRSLENIKAHVLLLEGVPEYRKERALKIIIDMQRLPKNKAEMFRQDLKEVLLAVGLNIDENEPKL